MTKHLIIALAASLFVAIFFTASGTNAFPLSAECNVVGLDERVIQTLKDFEFKDHTQGSWFVMDTILENERATVDNVYECLAGDFNRSFSRSDEQYARIYRSLDRVTQRNFYSPVNDYSFANVFVNRIASDYKQHRYSKTFPEGSVLVKETFFIVPTGQVSVGPMFIMEKMSSKYAEEQGNWRFVKVLQDGSRESDHIDLREMVSSCLSCHEKKRNEDFIFFLGIVAHLL